MSRITKSTIIVGLLLCLIYVFFEPIMIKAQMSDSKSFLASLNVTGEIALTAPGDITMSPALTLTQNTSLNNAAGTAHIWNVETYNYGGYTFTLKAGAAPAMISSDGRGNSFADYTAATAAIPETWSVSSAYEFGFSVFGLDTPTATWGTDTDCSSGSGLGVPSAGLKWRGFDGTNEIVIATSGSPTETGGTETSFCVAAEQNGVYAPSGSFSATITGTATTN